MPNHRIALWAIPNIPTHFFAKGSYEIDLLKVVDIIEKRERKEPYLLLVCENCKAYLAINSLFQQNAEAIGSVCAAIRQAASNARN